VRIIDLHNFKGPTRREALTSAIYVGRSMPGIPGSPLANPFKVQQFGNLAIPRYQGWLAEKVADDDPSVMNALREISSRMYGAGAVLACWCIEVGEAEVFETPYRCHAQVIAEFVRNLSAECRL
jgi:hypothetical protein